MEISGKVRKRLRLGTDQLFGIDTSVAKWSLCDSNTWLLFTTVLAAPHITRFQQSCLREAGEAGVLLGLGNMYACWLLQN